MKNLQFLAPEEYEIGHYFAGGLYAKKMILSAGGVAISHIHEYDHLSILGKGTAIVTVDGETKTYETGDCLIVKKGQQHEIQAITDIIWYCIHNEEVALCHGQ